MTSEDVLELVYGALTATPSTTEAAARVFRPGDWPTQPGDYPVIKLRVVGEQKQSLGRNTVEFTTLTTVRLIGEVSAPGQVDNAGATEAEAALWRLQRQYETAIINSYPLFARIQQLASVTTQLAFTAAATHLAGIQSDMAFEYYQGPEDFAPVELLDLDAVSLAALNHPPAGFLADLPQE